MKEIQEGLPTIFTPEEVATHFGWSPRRLREFARDIGACRVLGKRMVFTQEDVDTILEASKPLPTPKPTYLPKRSRVERNLHPEPSGGSLAAARLKLKQLKEAKKTR